MYDLIRVCVSDFLFATPPTSLDPTTYEYWLLCAISACICMALLYFPFAIVRWFFRGLS